MLFEGAFIQDEDFEDFESKYNNCYVYELFVKSTGEIFYVGRDSEEEWDEPMDVFSPLYKGWADRISQQVETGKRILKTGLRESVANHYVLKRIKEICNDNMLCNQQNCAFWGDDSLKVGVTPKFEVCPIEQHYLGKTAICFDAVDISNLTTVYLETGYLSYKEIIEDLYGDHYEDYYNELIQKLAEIGAKTVKSQYAKSVKSWIYLGRTIRLEYEEIQERAISKLGRNVPTYHIFDVLNALKDIEISSPSNTITGDIEISPIHNRCPWQNIKNLNDFSAGFRDGYHFWEAGEKFRLQGDIAEAILLFDRARENGYDAPVLYESYEKAYRKTKDYENEIAILTERYERNQAMHGNDRAWDGFFVELKEKIERSKKRLIQLRNKNK